MAQMASGTQEAPWQSRISYHIHGEEALESPALIYYEDIIRCNIQKAIELAGGPERLWPHVKTHKMETLVRLQLSYGIKRFKCATLAEAEMTARAGAPYILISYPLVGPAIERLIRLRRLYSFSEFWAIGDNIGQLTLLGQAARSAGMTLPVLIDVNMGMNRTGVLIDKLHDFCIAAAGIDGLALKGLHCYDGHFTIKNPQERLTAVGEKTRLISHIRQTLAERGIDLSVMVMGGTPTFPCHAQSPGTYLSPGTFFVHDYGYSAKYRDLDFTPGAALLTRVISRPAEGLFTLDLGCKAIAADPESPRGLIVDYPTAQSVTHSEEHWVFRLEGPPPPVGAILYVLPTHICPTTALYPGAWVAREGRLAGYWEVTARNRKLTV